MNINRIHKFGGEVYVLCVILLQWMIIMHDLVNEMSVIERQDTQIESENKKNNSYPWHLSTKVLLHRRMHGGDST
jgi:hypothetical protein